MTADKLVSVIMPVYNGEKYLAEAMESILNQTYKNIELIIVNNSSTDTSISLAESVKDKRIRIINNDSSNPFSGYNRGIDNSTGTFIAFMDQDDICSPERIETQLAYLQKHNLDLCGSFYNIVTEDNRVIEKRYLPVDSHDIRKELLFKNYTIFNPTVFCRASVFEKYGRFNCDLFPSADYDFYLRISNDIGIGNVPQHLYSWRLNSLSVSHNNEARVYNRTMSVSLLHLEQNYKDRNDYLFIKSLVYYYNNYLFRSAGIMIASLFSENITFDRMLYLLKSTLFALPLRFVRKYHLTYSPFFRKIRDLLNRK